MRLGGFFEAQDFLELEPLCEKLDAYGLSAISAPRQLAEWSIEKCAKFGEDARDLNLVVGEVGMWNNLMTESKDVQSQRIEIVRTLLNKADAMGCRVRTISIRWD